MYSFWIFLAHSPLVPQRATLGLRVWPQPKSLRRRFLLNTLVGFHMFLGETTRVHGLLRLTLTAGGRLVCWPENSGR